jgi:hypothetical protein
MTWASCTLEPKSFFDSIFVFGGCSRRKACLVLKCRQTQAMDVSAFPFLVAQKQNRCQKARSFFKNAKKVVVTSKNQTGNEGRIYTLV